MPYMRERTCFHSDLTVKMILNFNVSSNFYYKIFGVPTPLYTKLFSPWIWANLKNDPGNVKNRGIPRIRGTLTCLITISQSDLNELSTRNSSKMNFVERVNVTIRGPKINSKMKFNNVISSQPLE